MKSVYIVSSRINDTPTIKIKKFRFSTLPLKVENEERVLKTTKLELIEYWKWFNSVEEAEKYLENL